MQRVVVVLVQFACRYFAINCKIFSRTQLYIMHIVSIK